MKTAITRQVAATINECELVELARTPIDVRRARDQHKAYCALLTRRGWTVETLPPNDDWPDSVFVEDAALIFDDFAVITRPGAASRRNEAAPIAELLAGRRPLLHLAAPGTLDGGDVIIQGRHVWIGQSTRTNSDALRQMRDLLTPRGYTVTPVPVAGCLHLKSAATAVGPGHIALNPAWVDPTAFAGRALIETPPGEPSGANVLDLGDVMVVASAFPQMRARVEKAGFACESLDADELAKAEGALTCCSLLLGD